MKLETAKLKQVRRETRFELHVQLDEVPKRLRDAYKQPGMHVVLKVGDAEAGIGLASRPGDELFEMLVEADTPLGKALADASPGQSVKVSEPMGSGVPLFEHRDQAVYFVARGAGMGPLRAAVLHAITESGAFASLRVFCEGTYPKEIPYHAELPAWQRAGVTVFQTLSRPDVAKWKSQGTLPVPEPAYVYDFLRTQTFNVAEGVVFVAGPDDMVQGVAATLRDLELPPDMLYVFELDATRKQHRARAERPEKDLAKISHEGFWGSGHHDDAPDHPPVLVQTGEHAKPSGVPRYKKEKTAHK